jgi:hypothetical protein
MKESPFDANLDGSGAKPDPQQLPARNYPVLSPGQGGQAAIPSASGQFTPYVGVN